MIDGYPCPICGYNDVDSGAYREEFGAVEEYIHCSQCNYHYEYLYNFDVHVNIKIEELADDILSIVKK